MLGWHPCSQGIQVYVSALDAVIALGCGSQMNGTCQCYTVPLRMHIKGPLRDYSVSVHNTATLTLPSLNLHVFTSSHLHIFTFSHLHSSIALHRHTLNNHNAFLHHRRNTPCQHRHCDARPFTPRLQWALLQGQLRCQWHQLRQPHLCGLAFHGH